MTIRLLLNGLGRGFIPRPLFLFKFYSFLVSFIKGMENGNLFKTTGLHLNNGLANFGIKTNQPTKKRVHSAFSPIAPLLYRSGFCNE